MNKVREMRRPLPVLILVALGLCVSFGVVALGPRVLILAAGVLIFVWLVRQPQWSAPFVMFCVAAVPIGYPFELSFRLSVSALSVSITEGALLLALAATLFARFGSGRPLSPPLSPRARLVAALLFGVFVLGVAVGVGMGHTLENMLRDVRVLYLYSALFLVVPADPDVQLRRLAIALVGGLSVVAAVQVGAQFIHVLHDFFLVDRGRVWFGNGVLYPLAIPLGLGLLVAGRSRSQTILWASCTCLMAAGLVMSLTRGHWLATVASVVTMGLMVVTRAGRTGRRVLRTLIVASVALVLALGLTVTVVGAERVTSAFADVWPRIQSLGELSNDSSLATRASNLDSVNAQIAANPLLGTGAGTTMVLRSGEGVVYSESAQYVDNVPQTLLVKYGVVGAIPFVWFWFVSAAAGWRLRHSQSLLGIAFAAAIPGLAILCFMSSYLVAGAPVVALVMIAGVLLRCRPTRHPDQRNVFE
jgi:hypothetical protein